MAETRGAAAAVLRRLREQHAGDGSLDHCRGIEFTRVWDSSVVAGVPAKHRPFTTIERGTFGGVEYQLQNRRLQANLSL